MPRCQQALFGGGEVGPGPLSLLTAPGTELLAGRGEVLCSETECTRDEDWFSMWSSCILYEKGASCEDRGYEDGPQSPRLLPTLLFCPIHFL